MRIVQRRDADVAGHVEEQANGQLGGRRHEALVGSGDQYAVGRRRIDIDRARVDRTSQEGNQVRQLLEESCVSRRRSVGDDDVAVRCRVDQLGRREVASGRIQHDLGDLCEVGERPAVVRLEILGVVGEEHAHEINANSANDAMRPTYQPIA